MKCAAGVRGFTIAFFVLSSIFTSPAFAADDEHTQRVLAAQQIQIHNMDIEDDETATEQAEGGMYESGVIDFRIAHWLQYAREAADYQWPSPLDERSREDALDPRKRAAALASMERQARARDAQATASGDAARLRMRALEWRHIGVYAFLDNTARAIAAFEQALQFAPDDAKALDGLAWLYGMQGRDDQRRMIAERLTRLNDPTSRALGFIHLADILLDANNGAGARPHVDQALTLVRGRNAPRLEAMVLALLAGTQLSARDYDDAETSTERSLALSRANGFDDERAVALYIQGTAQYARGVSSLLGRRGRFERAERVYEELETLLKCRHDDIAVAQLLIRRGQVARLMENYPLSERRLLEALASLDRLGVRTRYGFAQQQLAVTLAKQRRFDEAIPLFQASIEDARRMRQPHYEGNALFEWAQAEAARSDNARACRLVRDATTAFQRAPGHEGMARAMGPFRLIWGCSQYQ